MIDRGAEQLVQRLERAQRILDQCAPYKGGTDEGAACLEAAAILRTPPRSDARPVSSTVAHAEALDWLEDTRRKLSALTEAVRALYFAAHWHPDRPVDERALWTAVRDAAGFTPGASSAHLGAAMGSDVSVDNSDMSDDYAREWLGGSSQSDTEEVEVPNAKQSSEARADGMVLVQEVYEMLKERGQWLAASYIESYAGLNGLKPAAAPSGKEGEMTEDERIIARHAGHP